MNAHVRVKMNDMSTRSGRAFALADISYRDIDLFEDVAEPLARIERFGSQMETSNIYSVAQHCVIGFDAVLEETRNADAAAYFLLHDAHEAYTGDIITPVSEFFSYLELELCGTSDVVRTIIVTAKQRIDEAIWRAARLVPPARIHKAIVKDMDFRMFAAEQRQLRKPPAGGWSAEIMAAKSVPMRGALKPWPIATAALEYRKRLTSILERV